jgi:hypothetical protein
VEISDVSSAMTAMTAGRLQSDVATRVLKTALTTSDQAALGLISALQQSVPAGLTYTSSGLVPASSANEIARL